MNKLLTCKYIKCQKYLLNPIILNCSNNVCKSHVDELIDESNETYVCFVCNKKHYINKDGFVVNTVLNELMMQNMHLNDEQKAGTNLINKFKTLYLELEQIINNPESFIFDYISTTRNRIDLERERLIYEINTVSNEMLEQLKHFEDECNENLNKLNDLNEEHKSDLINYSNDLAKWNELLRTPNVDKYLIEDLMDEAKKLIIEMEEKIFDYKNNFLMNKECYFNGGNTKFDSELFGEFYVGDTFRSSILSPSQSIDLIKLCEFTSKTKLHLLYQATRDGFSSETFHGKCDGIPNTLIVVKVKGNSNVFGGFCSLTWDKSYVQKNDPKAFIFSLLNKDNLPLKINVTNPSNAIFCNSSYGPIFGAGNGNDFVISNNSNMNQQSYSNLGYSYKSSLYPCGTMKAQSYLAGSYYFSTEEIEVYQVL